MTGTLLQEAKQETWPASEERKYLRVIKGKVVYISEAEAMKEEVLAGPRKTLSGADIFLAEWDFRVRWANQLKERISLVHQMMRDDEQRPSQYEPAYNTLWGEYRDAIESLRELDSEPVGQFRDKVVARVKELEVKLSAMCDSWDEQMLACYEKNFDLMTALQPSLPSRALALEA